MFEVEPDHGAFAYHSSGIRAGSESFNTAFPNNTSSVNFCSSLEPLWGPKRDPLYIVVPVTVLYSLIFLTGVVGNVCTCVVIARNRHMQTTTNYYLFSLAISDVLLLVSGLPTEMYTVWSKYPYVFGETFCVISGLASETSSNATVLTITAFTVERYVAICHPFHTHVVSKLSRAIKFVIAIWLIALACAVPQAAQLGLVYAKDDISGEKVSEEYKICGLKSPYPYAFETFTVLFFFAPMTVITILYMLIGIKLHSTTKVKSGQRLRDSRKSAGYGTTRVVKMLVVVVVAFFICWAPFQAQRLFAVYGANTSPRMILMYKAITYMSGLLYYLSTTINPFLYNIMSLKFREAFKYTSTSHTLIAINHDGGHWHFNRDARVELSVSNGRAEEASLHRSIGNKRTTAINTIASSGSRRIKECLIVFARRVSQGAGFVLRL
ncbi:unnamed protein product [Nesidiocoris tenuis]|uniref:G-protein coupled receptors family 1 profile domain-containing protein n=1 Tax=Nesidiocoris tenuis TaxID=355587 RepID=A0A6H5FWF7_9HEMI|nr:unnamed protein product [Nesidiocoris tenuis]